jgi:ATP-dependent Clp protease ATP-binding subunit ClpC
MFERFTDTARRTVVLAQEEARMLNHNYIGTEHLLLALLNERAMSGMAGKALDDTGVTAEEARGHICGIIGVGLSEVTGHIPFTSRAKSVLEDGFRTAIALGHGYIGPEHLLAGLLTADKSVATQTLMRCGVAPATVRSRLGELFAWTDLCRVSHWAPT